MLVCGTIKSLSKRTQLLGLLGWLLISFTVSALGALASVQAKFFYAELVQPAWAPPSWLFGPVWMTLYLMMAVAAWLVWRNGGFSANRIALSFFFAQLALNILWSWLFFAWHLGALAFVDIILLWVFITVTLAFFWHARPLAGALLIPYLCWVSFAAFLNYSVWQLNPLLLGH